MSVNKRTKIICTIGPSSHTEERLIAMVEAGMNVCRLNFSHGTHDDHAELIRLIRAVSEKTHESLAILQDLQGPKIRVGKLPEEGIRLVAGEDVVFTTEEGTDPKKIFVSYPKLHEDAKEGHRFLLDDGLLMAKVKRIEGHDVVCEVLVGGTLTSHKGLNLPDTKTTVSSLSDKDRDDVAFGVAQGVDWIALSFVRSAEDIRELRTLIEQEEKKQGIVSPARILIMAKVEKPEAVVNMDEIIKEADGIMVARGDLGIEVPAERVPLIQKEMIEKCLFAAKPVVVATQMLDSMIHRPRATRAEVSDIANAVIDHTDATMLSGESASGDYPVEAVQTMAATISETEQSKYDDLSTSIRAQEDTELAMTNMASVLAMASQAKAILVASMTGRAARLVSRYRPELPIVVATPFARVVRQLNLSWGVHALQVRDGKSRVELLELSQAYLKKSGYLKDGEEVIVVAGEPMGQPGHINLVEVRQV